MHINNVKSIKSLTFSFPLEKGLYAITGENASGKSTLVACELPQFVRTVQKHPCVGNIYFKRSDAALAAPLQFLSGCAHDCKRRCSRQSYVALQKLFLVCVGKCTLFL